VTEPVLRSFGEQLHHLAVADPDAVNLIWITEDGSETTHTRRELDDRSTQLARVLAEHGVGISDLVSLAIRNSPEFIIGCFATWKLGATVIPMRWDLPDWEYQRVRSVAAPKVILDEDTRQLFDEAATRSTEPFDFPVSPIAHGICSSGSTGTPKVILRKAPAIWPEGTRSTAIQEGHGSIRTDEQVVLVAGPMYHTNGFTGTSDLLSGHKVVLLERFRPEQAIGAIERHRVTGMVAATPLLQRIAQVPDVRKHDFSSMQWALQGAALIPPWVAELWFDLIGAENMILLYGSTEGHGVVAITGDDYRDHPGSLGKGFAGTQVKILDADHNELPPGEIGEIFTRPADGQLVHEYLGDVPPAPMTDDGFVSVGDLGWVDDDGWLYMADRRVDMIKSGGANVFPAEVEVALSEHPHVADVVVIGLSDPDWGKRVHAIVAASDPSNPPSPDEIIAYAKERMAPYKVPKTVEYLEEIPRSEAGKVSRNALIAEREPTI
jgi:bile acid-coenzyme A ligase